MLAQSQFTVRGDQLSETYSFSCQEFQGELDAVTVHFSEPVGNLDWSILSDNETTAIARRLNTTESNVECRVEQHKKVCERVLVGRIESSGDRSNNSQGNWKTGLH